MEARMPRADKVAKVEELTQRFRGASGAMFVDFRGLNVKDATELRRTLKGAGATFLVAKNTLTRLAAREAGMDQVIDLLEGPTAIAFLDGDPVAGAKALLDAGRRFPALEVKGALIEGHILDEGASKALASIESKDVSVAKVAGILTAPLQRTAYLLRAPLQRIAYALAERGRQEAA
jgi:large subunit ribosomal protein L10